MKQKPILFNTDMVRAILDNRKTVTRRVVKPPVTNTIVTPPLQSTNKSGYWAFYGEDGLRRAPYHPGDILYVRETWRVWRAHRYEADVHIEFKAGGDRTTLQFPHGGTDSVNRKDYDKFLEKCGIGARWRPSIHMPREAARIFLRVTDVRVERLWGITEDGAVKEGCQSMGMGHFVRADQQGGDCKS